MCIKSRRRALRSHGAMRDPEDFRQKELLAALRLLKNGEDPAAVLERLSQRLTNKLLHAPTKEIGA